MELSSIAKELQAFSEKHDLINEALSGCVIALENCKKENPEEAELIEDTKIKFEKQEFIFNESEAGSPFVRTRMTLYIADTDSEDESELEKHGYYLLDTDKDGKHFDDWLVFEN